MNKGVIISGFGHVGLILWAILGGWISAPQEVPEIQVVDVSMISTAEFDAMTSSAPTASFRISSGLGSRVRAAARG